MMMNFKVLQEGYLLAERLGKTEAAANFLAKINQVRRDQPESIAPRDEARFELTRIERMLHQAPPFGFQEVQAALRSLVSRLPAAVKEPAYHVYLAASLGQQYAFEKQSGRTEAELAPLVEQAIATIRQARYAGQTDWLHYLADPARGAADPDRNDDLVEIAKLPAVRAELGLG